MSWNDKSLLKLIQKYLQSGVLINGIILDTNEGTPQGGLCEALHKPPCGFPFEGLPSPSISAFNILL